MRRRLLCPSLPGKTLISVWYSIGSADTTEYCRSLLSSRATETEANSPVMCGILWNRRDLLLANLVTSNWRKSRSDPSIDYASNKRKNNIKVSFECVFLRLEGLSITIIQHPQIQCLRPWQDLLHLNQSILLFLSHFLPLLLLYYRYKLLINTRSTIR
jgi:hypothetical protein